MNKSAIMMESIPIGPAAVTVAACIVLGRYMNFVPPIAVVVRKARPVVTGLGLVSWLLYRIVLVQDGPSFLELVVEHLHRASDWLSSLESSYPTALLQWTWLVCQDFLAILMCGAAWRVVYCLFHYTLEEWKDLFIQAIFEFSQQHMPIVRGMIAQYKTKTSDDMKHIIGKNPNRRITATLPENGMDSQLLLEQFQTSSKQENQVWQEGKVSGAVYPASPAHTQLMQGVYAAFTWSNPLHYGIWPTVNQCEAEVIAMTANLLHCPGVGTTSSGGTESIVLAIRAHKEFYGRMRGISYPELVCGSTAHAAVDKACEMLGIRKVCVDVDPTEFTLVPALVEKRITSNTILIYASAPTFGQGVIDPIQDLSKLALQYDVGLHVDACLGGFVLPFARKLGYPIPQFDFECPGVTSMSADTHKFAYACKGTSVVLYRNKELRHAQYFSYSKWTGGLYSTPTIAGSRPGALLACAWAALVSIGESGYKERVASILEASRQIADGISQISGIRLLMGRQAPTMIVCFDTVGMDIYRVGSKMKGWELNSLQNPPCIHLCVTLNTIPHVDKFIEDLRLAVDQVRQEGPSAKKSGSAAIYGLANGIPAGPVNELLRIFTDETLTP